MTNVHQSDPTWMMTVTETRTPASGRRVSLVIQGELDAARCGEFKQELLALLELRTPSVLDLSQVRFCSVACIEAIAECAALANKRSISLSIFAPRVVAKCLQLYEPAPKVVTLDDEGMPAESIPEQRRVRTLQAS